MGWTSLDNQMMLAMLKIFGRKETGSSFLWMSLYQLKIIIIKNLCLKLHKINPTANTENMLQGIPLQ